MVYSGNGQSLLGFNDDGGGYPNSRITFWAGAGQSYKIVAGAYGNNSSGEYELAVSSSWVFTPLTPLTTSAQLSGSAVSTMQLYSAGAGRNLRVNSVMLP